MFKSFSKISIILILLLNVLIVKPEERVFTSKEENNKCFKCHASRKYIMSDPKDSTKRIFGKMPVEYIIDTNQYYNSNHWDFGCSMCHSSEYSTVPHNSELRFTEIPGCMDCHGGDPTYAKYKFEIIDEEFQKSVHFKNHNDDFSCWECHNPHSYKINARNKHQRVTKTIQYDNEICLGCHDNNDNLKYFDKSISSISKTHDWLPNQIAHFKKVRCIECHAIINDSILAAHNVQPKQNAIRDCNQCHSPNSILMKSLYQDFSRKDRMGFFNSIILKDAYVAGTNRNYFLNIISLVILGLSLLAVSIHIFFRFRNK